MRIHDHALTGRRLQAVHTGLEGAGEAVRNAARIGEGYDVGVPLRANAA
jgi:hypothetical protein